MTDGSSQQKQEWLRVSSARAYGQSMIDDQRFQLGPADSRRLHSRQMLAGGKSGETTIHSKSRSCIWRSAVGTNMHKADGGIWSILFLMAPRPWAAEKTPTLRPCIPHASPAKIDFDVGDPTTKATVRTSIVGGGAQKEGVCDVSSPSREQESPRYFVECDCSLHCPLILRFRRSGA